MPISTDSDTWRTADPPKPPVRERLRAFFWDHRGEAFHVRELADELADTDWASIHEQERKDDADGRASSQSPAETMSFRDRTARLKVFLTLLEEESEIEVREVPIEDTEIPFEGVQENVAFYTLNE